MALRELIIGMGDDTPQNRHATFMRSVNQCGYEGAVCLFTHDPLPWHPVVDRWKLIADYLASAAHDEAIACDRVIVCDTFDVVFQENPFPRLEKLLGEEYDLVVVSEERLFKDCEGNKRGMLQSFPEFYKDLADKEIINAGVVAGRAIPVWHICKEIYNWCQQDKRLPIFTPGFQDRLPDQQALNIVLPDYKARIVGGKEAWAFQYNHAHQMRDGIMYNGEGQRYAILHQYLYQWKEAVERQYP